jgi:two-component system, NarL family, sensor kinase
MATSIDGSSTAKLAEDHASRLSGAGANSGDPEPLWIYATTVLLVTAGAIALFELSRPIFFPGPPHWPSRVARLVLASMAAALSGYFVLHRQRLAEHRAHEQVLAKYRSEESLLDFRQQLAQKHREEREIRDAQQLLQAAVDALSAHVAILDDQGNIIAVNQAWRRFAEENGFAGTNYGVGSRYLDFGNPSAEQDAGVARRGIGEVLEGHSEGFRLLYPCTCVNGQRWFQLRVSQFTEREARRLLVSHEDVTEVKMAQDARRDIDNRILQSREEERRRIARELHDSTVQKIFAVNLNLMGIKTTLGSAEKKIHELLAETIALGRECMQELRTISYLLRPPLPAGHDFLPALHSYIDGFCKRSGIRVNLVLPAHASRMPAKIENALFRVVQETLSNIHRHSQSATATVALRTNDVSVVLEVKDKGKGMPAAPETGLYGTTGGGLAGIEERVHELGGSLEIKPANPGTIVTATIPLAELSVQRGMLA